MPTDARIALGGQQFNAKQSIDIFNNSVLNLQNRKESEARLSRGPLIDQQLQQQVDQGALQQRQQISDQRLSSVAQTSQIIGPLIQQGRLQEAKGVLEQNLLGLSPEDQAEGIEMLSSNPESLLETGRVSIQAFRARQEQANQQRVAPTQFGGEKFFKDEENNQFVVTTRRNPNTGEVSTVSRSVDGSERQPIGKLSQTGSFGQTAQENVENRGRIVATEQQAKANSELGREQINKIRLSADETKVKNDQKRADLINAKKAAFTEANTAISTIDGLLKDDQFKVAFGKIDGSKPDLLRSQSAIDVKAQVEQVTGLLSLESRQKLKGQGQISDSESKTLEKSATVLANPNISDDLARKELRKVRNTFESAADRSRLKPETIQQEQQSQPQQQPSSGSFTSTGGVSFTVE